jgi:hypothetical protein
MEQIIIDGINLSELKIEYDALAAKQAEMRKSIAKGSNKFIAESIQEAKNSMDEILACEDADVLDSLIETAYAKLTNASFVSDVSGVSYVLPYYDRQSEYEPDGERYSSQFDETENEILPGYGENKKFDKLLGLLEKMEDEVAEWNTSYC